ncbi:progestin and adipoQ receptor family member 3-like isoform X1 [Mercenaria mercenaria]|uniref:progestin and adipoQ receptor family member 3-like isoform X1 n=1 Tax=Mercenaria mercenaria TaxID=6596 RepID=UPI001E1D56D2|nr:progestin and adipoQ receptor family member 3-like isoform X1 [Mercenaria mercenaria]
MMGRQGPYENIKNRQTVGITRHESYSILDIEIDESIESTLSSGLCDLKEKDITLHKYQDIPEFLQGNPYVTEGYRVSLPFSLCLKSMFVWTNETINIWSHLGGFFLFIFFMLYDNIIEIPRNDGTLADHIIVTIGLICYQFCMLCSAGFHMFGCHSERASKRWLAVDLAGILVGVIGCYLPAVHYAFFCLSIWRDIYLFTIAVLTGLVIFVQFHPQYFHNHWFKQRMAVYIGLVAYGVIPASHWFFLNGGWNAEIVRMFIPKVVTMYCLGMLAFSFYITKFPERFFPGYFNFVGSSHNAWHIGIVAAFVWMQVSLWKMITYRKQNPCFQRQ